MAMFASNNGTLPALTSSFEKMGLSDGAFSPLDPVHPSAKNVVGNEDTALGNHHAKEPMHSILKSHASGDEKQEESRSAPVDVPMKKSVTAPDNVEASALVGSFSSSPKQGSYQDMYRLWVDEDESSEFPQIVPPARRSLSLKTQKTPPGTPGPKKMVRFADAMGLDLEKVRHFFKDQLPDTESAMEGVPVSSIPTPKYTAANPKYLSPSFPQPCLSSTFLDRVRSQKVCLDSVQVNECLVTGFIRVLNVAFDKTVVVRYTFDNWKTSLDTVAQYVPNSNDNFSDRFQFMLHAPPYFEVGQTLQFCLCYRTGGQEFWDSNYGQNYLLICCAGTEVVVPAFSSMPHSPATNAFW